MRFYRKTIKSLKEKKAAEVLTQRQIDFYTDLKAGFDVDFNACLESAVAFKNRREGKGKRLADKKINGILMRGELFDALPVKTVLACRIKNLRVEADGNHLLKAAITDFENSL